MRVAAVWLAKKSPIRQREKLSFNPADTMILFVAINVLYYVTYSSNI